MLDPVPACTHGSVCSENEADKENTPGVAPQQPPQTPDPGAPPVVSSDSVKHRTATLPSLPSAACSVPDALIDVLAPSGDAHEPITLKTSTGRTWTMQVSALSMCDPGAVTLSSDHQDDYNPDVDPDASEVQLFMHFYTKKDKSGTACVPGENGECWRMSRRLPLRHNPAQRSFVGRLYPDPSSDHYAFELRVRACCISRYGRFETCKSSSLCDGHTCLAADSGCVCRHPNLHCGRL